MRADISTAFFNKEVEAGCVSLKALTAIARFNLSDPVRLGGTAISRVQDERLPIPDPGCLLDGRTAPVGWFVSIVEFNGSTERC